MKAQKHDFSNIRSISDIAHYRALLQNELKSSEQMLRKDWNNITTGIITYGPELRQSEYARSRGVHLYSGGDLPELSLLGTGHYIDIEGDTYPDKQKCYKAPNGYAIVPFFRKNL